MDQNLVDLQNNYNYLFESVKNNSMSIEDAINTLENLSVVDASGKLWKMNVHGQFISGYPGSELQPSNAEAFSSDTRNNNNYDRNLNLPPSANGEYFTPYQEISTTKKKATFPKFNSKKVRTPLIIFFCILIGLYFFTQKESLPTNEIVSEGGVSGGDVSVGNTEGNLLNIDDIDIDNGNKSKENKLDIDSGDSSIALDADFGEVKKEINKILTSLNNKEPQLSRIINENDSSNQRLLYEAQLIGYLSVGLKFNISEIDVKNNIYYYKVEVKKNSDVLLLGEGRIEGIEESLSKLEITWPKFKRVS
jgi:hypothetical protein